MHPRTPHDTHQPARSSRLRGALAVAAVAAFVPCAAGCEVAALVALLDSSDGGYDGLEGGGGSYDDYLSNGGSSGYAEDTEETYLGVENAKVHGSLGEAIGFGGDASSAEAYDTGYHTSITILADSMSGSRYSDTQWATMTVIEINGGLRDATFQPGAKLKYSSANEEQRPYVHAWGCSGTGPYADDLDYDADSTGIDIEVGTSEKPGMVHLQFTVTYSSEEVVEGELDITVP